jgi:hypothetical protein
MKQCEQFTGMSVYEHGILVSEWLSDLYENTHSQKPLRKQWRESKWIGNKLLIEKLLPFKILETYAKMHDAGKPYCRTVDDQGRQHFPNHAEVSKNVWNEVSEDTPESRIVGDLIGMDMMAHTVRGEELQAFAKHPYAPSLLYTAFAEVHSNASWLNALDSDSFKIKIKQLDKVAKAILSVYN